MNFGGQQDAHDDIEFNLIPLIDVILCLLIFFVVTTTFQQQALVRIDLPEASADATTMNSDSLEILIDANGRFYLNQLEVLQSDPASLREAVQAYAADASREQPVTVRADAQTPHQAVITAMDVLGQLGFSRISLATVRSGEGG
ncbi:ExbD/TolR family protein [Pseudofulvimonas gallinarii]|jgi:biopolymer transport protein ExbD|uniref:Biopolymer transport protein ExbD n=1 Tax=Pseudofulvimonas gallinarii TaxID=634155 RepID=A0A4R3LSS9_9GAMM|nr:biopolymer transporter ExbD [Pseudofulvimonas gallinarii]TCT01307.1 biopolymer transport protein ExbD [Pseudofulvimonas gallinarii]THD15066.1 hypothetical protein B1808_01325 [Pseudofulvimonas gallinarii]